ncbi:hypothetical protein MEW_05754 [Candida albicans P60002]|nr:hypothetical protein MEK_05805 [Candida albicans 12C]KGU02560.1 hypothetical protein MEY_05761 [Candida albicans 19F]KHC45211.1 hypothetical protein MEW_05754 [Candida albicans P60002]
MFQTDLLNLKFLKRKSIKEKFSGENFSSLVVDNVRRFSLELSCKMLTYFTPQRTHYIPRNITFLTILLQNYTKNSQKKFTKVLQHESIKVKLNHIPHKISFQFF